MNINLSLSPALTIINKLVVVIYKASAKNTPVDHQEFNPPHTNARNLSFVDVDPTTYIVNTYETTGWPSLGTLRHSFIYDPSYTKVGIRPTEFLHMTVDGTGYTDSTWAGWEIDTIERVGVGAQYPGEDVLYYISGNGYRRDGFDLYDNDDRFSAGEKFVIRFKPNITVGTPTLQSSRIFTGTEVITADTLIDDTYKGKLLLVNSADATVTLTFKAISILGAYDIWGIVNNGGSQILCRIISESGSDNFQFNRGLVNEIMLGQSEQLLMMGDPLNGWIVLQASATILQAGQFVDAYSIDTDPNVRHCAGQEVSRSVYRRIWMAVQDMPAGTLVSDTVWNTTSGGQNNKGFFSTGNGTTTFRFPRIYDAGMFRAVDGSTDTAGTYEADKMKKFWPGDIDRPCILKIDGINTTDETTPDSGSEPNIVSPLEITKAYFGDEVKVRTFGAFKLIRI